MFTSGTAWYRTRRFTCAWLVLGLSACGGDEFASGPSAGAGAGGSAGSDSGGSSNGEASGSSSDAGMAGDPETGGSEALGGGGTGGGGSSACDCGPGQYCREGSLDCLDCAELSRLRFSDPEKLASLSPGTAARFPRAGLTGTDLVYAAAGLGLRYTTDSSTSAGNAVPQTIAEDSGALLLAAAVTNAPGLPDFNFAFDRQVEGGQRRLFVGAWGDAGLTSVMQAPGPYNGGDNDFGWAIARDALGEGVARAYWMSDRDPVLGLSLLTAELGDMPAGGPVTLLVGHVGCVAEHADLTPWVTPDGQTLLFSHPRLDENCESAGQGKDLYTVLLVPATGSPPLKSPAVPLQDVNGPADDVDPSFSADFCELYFASNRGGEYALYRARRR